MVPLSALWLPIGVAAGFVFLASFVFWMVSPHHRSDWAKLPHEDEVLDCLRRHGVGRGQYTFPHCRPAERQDPAMKAKMAKGPLGFLVLFPPGPPAMGKSMVLSFLHDVLVSLFVAYIAGRTLAPGAEYLRVFQVAGTAAILAYAGALPTAAIWFGRTWTSVLKEMADGVVYGLLTAGVFGWLWP